MTAFQAVVLLAVVVMFSRGFPSDDRTDETDNDEDEDESNEEMARSKIHNITENLKQIWNEKLDQIGEKWGDFKDSISSRKRRDFEMEEAEDDSKMMAFDKIINELMIMRDRDIPFLITSFRESFPDDFEDADDEVAAVTQYRKKREYREKRSTISATTLISNLDAEIRSLRRSVKDAASNLGTLMINRQRRDLAPLVGGLNSTVHGLLADLGGVVSGLGDILKGRKRRYLSSLVSGLNGSVHGALGDLGDSVKGVGDILSGRKRRQVSFKRPLKRARRELDDITSRTAAIVKQLTNIGGEKRKRDVFGKIAMLRKTRQSNTRKMQGTSSSEEASAEDGSQEFMKRQVTMTTTMSTGSTTTTSMTTTTPSSTTTTTSPTTTFPSGKFASQTSRPMGPMAMLMKSILGKDDDGQATVSAEDPTSLAKTMFKPKLQVKSKTKEPQKVSTEDTSSEAKNLTSSEAPSSNTTLSSSMRNKGQNTETTSKSSRNRRQPDSQEWWMESEEVTTPADDPTTTGSMTKREASLKDWLFNGRPFTGLGFHF